MRDAHEVQQAVHQRYAELAPIAREGGVACCGPEGEACFGTVAYSAGELAGLPRVATDASLGCGNPTAVAELHEGEVVLDLGSGGGSTSSFRPAGWAPPGRPMAWT